MKSVISVSRPSRAFCVCCTRKATKMVLIGQEAEHRLNAVQFYLCDECAEKLARRLTNDTEG